MPTAERPLRLAEFDKLFSSSLIVQKRLSPIALRCLLDPAVEPIARELTAKESECCSFFQFEFTSTEDTLELDVQVPEEQTEVLDALEQRAAAAMATT